MDETEKQEILEAHFREGTSFVMIDGQSVSARTAEDMIKLLGAINAGGTNANGGPKSGWNFLRPAQASLPGTGRDV